MILWVLSEHLQQQQRSQHIHWKYRFIDAGHRLLQTVVFSLSRLGWMIFNKLGIFACLSCCAFKLTTDFHRAENPFVFAIFEAWSSFMMPSFQMCIKEEREKRNNVVDASENENENRDRKYCDDKQNLQLTCDFTPKKKPWFRRTFLLSKGF